MKPKSDGGRIREDTVKADVVLLPPALESILRQLHELASNRRPEFLLRCHRWSPNRQGGGHLWVVLVKQ